MKSLRINQIYHHTAASMANKLTTTTSSSSPSLFLRYQSTTTSTQNSNMNSTDNQTPFYGTPRPLEQSNPHNPNTPLSNLLLTIHSATTAFLNPERADAVATLGEITGKVAVKQMLKQMEQSEIGRIILNERPIVQTNSSTMVNMETLHHFPKKSFGKAYADFMIHHGFNPDERTPIKYIQDPTEAYVMLRYRQCHDFFHVLTGLPPTVLGELALKWVELFQFGLPSAALSSTVGSLRLDEEERKILMEVYLPWACQVGKEGDFLLNVFYEKEFETDLDELRKRLRIVPAPDIS